MVLTVLMACFSDPGEGTSQFASHSTQKSCEAVFVNEGQETPKKLLQPKRFRKSPDVSTPRRAKRCLFATTTKLNKQRLQIKTLQQRNRRLEKRCRTLKDLLSHLKKKNLISEDCQDYLEVCNMYVFFLFFFSEKPSVVVHRHFIGFFL